MISAITTFITLDSSSICLHLLYVFINSSMKLKEEKRALLLGKRFMQNLRQCLEFTNGLSQCFKKNCQRVTVQRRVIQIQHLDVRAFAEHRAQFFPIGEYLRVPMGQQTP
jgi:hypothetical protein